jgi:HEAT repeat protein
MLDHLADDACVPEIVAATADPVPRVRRMAVHALGCQRCKPSALCSDLTGVLLPIAEGDPVWRVRQEAVISMLGQPASERSLDALDRIAAHDAHPEVRKQASWCARLLRGKPASWGVKRREA